MLPTGNPGIVVARAGGDGDSKTTNTTERPGSISGNCIEMVSVLAGMGVWVRGVTTGHPLTSFSVESSEVWSMAGV